MSLPCDLAKISSFELVYYSIQELTRSRFTLTSFTSSYIRIVPTIFFWLTQIPMYLVCCKRYDYFTAVYL